MQSRNASGIAPRRDAYESSASNYSDDLSSLTENELCGVEDPGGQSHPLEVPNTSQAEAQWDAQTRDLQKHREPPPGFTELPLCPRCLERVDTSVSGMIAPWLSSTSSVPISQYSALSYWPWLRCRVCALVAFVEQEGKFVCDLYGMGYLQVQRRVGGNLSAFKSQEKTFDTLRNGPLSLADSMVPCTFCE